MRSGAHIRAGTNMRAGGVGIASGCSCGGRFQKTHNGESSKDGCAEKGGRLLAGKALNIRDQLVEVSPAESIRHGADLVGGAADVLGGLRHVLVEFTCGSADRTGYATDIISAGGLLLFHRAQQFFPGLGDKAFGALRHIRGLLFHLPTTVTNGTRNLARQVRVRSAARTFTCPATCPALALRLLAGSARPAPV